MSKARHKLHLKICPTCGEEKLMRSVVTYCSHRCLLVGRESPQRAMKLEKHPGWKGANAGYNALHDRVRRHRGKPAFCVFGCNKSRFCWANLTGNYSDMEDYTSMCYSCHKRYDLAVLSLGES